MAPNTDDCEDLKFQTREIRFKWRIDDFMTNLPFMKDIVESQTFPGEDLPQWFLQMFPKGHVAGKLKFGVYLILKKAEKDEKSIVVDYNLQFLNDDGTEIDRQDESGWKFDEGKGRGFGIGSDSDDPIPLSTLGKLIVRVTICIRKPVQSDLFQFPIEIPESSAHEDWTKLLKSGDYADFIVESVDGKVFPVHKAILSTRNPQFFAVMFSLDVKEASESRVKLPFERKIVSALLEYIYSDEVVNPTPIATQLYAVAHQYQLNRLVVICAANISQNLTVANISVALHMAKLYGDAKLLSACQKFLDDHKSAAVQMAIDSACIDDLDTKSNGSWLCGLGRFLPNWC